MAAAVGLNAGALALLWSASPDLPIRGDVIYDWGVARQLLRGEGLTTTLMPLSGLKFLAERGLAARNPWPSAFKFAGSQARIAATIAVLGDTVSAVKLAAVVPYLVVCALIGAVLLRLGSSPWEAGLATAGFIGFGRLADLSVAGMSASADALLFLLAALGMADRGGRGRGARFTTGPVPAAGAGVAAGLLVLHRYSFIFFAVVPAAFFVWADRRDRRNRWTRGGAAAFGMAVVLAPFLGWSWASFGALFPSSQGDAILLHRTRYLLYDPWLVLDWPTLSSVLAADPLVLVDKALKGLLSYLAADPEPVVPWAALALPLAAWGLMRQGGSAGRWLAVFIGVNLLVQLPISAAPRYQLYALPLVYIALVRGWSDLAGRWAGGRRWSVAALGLGLLAFAAHGVHLRDVSSLRASGWRSDCRLQEDAYCTRDEVNAYLRSSLRPGDVVLGGDRPWEIASGTRLRVLPLPPAVADVRLLANAGIQPAAIFLPAALSHTGDGLRLPSWLEWWHAADADGGWLLPGYRTAHRFSDGATLLMLRPGAPGTAPLDQMAILRRLQTRVVEFGTVRGSYHELRGFSPLPGGGVRLAAGIARLGVHLPGGRSYRVRLTVKGEAGFSLGVDLHEISCGGIALSPDWKTGEVTIPASTVGAGGWCVLELDGEGAGLRRAEIESLR